jgi:acetyl esterase/lipase
MISQLVSHPLLENFPLVILDCDYAKAPENPYPAATDDARDVLEYVFAHPEVYDLSRVTMGGSSAGANIAMGISATIGKEAREGKGPLKQSTGHPTDHPIKGLFALYPPTEYDSRPDMTPPPDVHPPGVALPKHLTDTFDGAYLFPSGPLSTEEAAKRKQEQLQTPLITPRWADIRDFPRIIGLITCEYDPLVVEAENWRAELMKKESGKDVSGWIVKNVAHGWDNLVLPGQPGYEERQKAYDLLAEVIAKSGGVSI